MKQALLFIKKYMLNLLMHKTGKVSFLLVFVLMMMGGGVLGQTTLLTENFGTTTSLPTGWTSSNTTNGWSASTSSVSSTYTGYSAGANVLFAGTGTTGTNHTLTYSNNFSTVGYNSITVLWGGRGTSTFNGTITFQWSSDGTTWNNVSYTYTVAGNAWALVNSGSRISLPASAAGLSNLRFRWSALSTNNGNYRIDDFTVQGTATNTPTITGAATAAAFATTYGTASAPQSFSISGANLTTDITATAQTGFEVSSDGNTYGSTATFTQASGSVSSNLYVRLAATAATGTYNNTTCAILSSTGATSVSISTSSSGNSVTATSPALTAAFSASVDAPFNVTFTDNASWRAAITSITVGGTTLSSSAYTISSGQITFTPSASSLLQSSGTKAIVVIATGYNNATVSQVIGAGAPAKLTMLTQPTAPATNGALLAVQPSVAIQDQYGNATTSTASVSAAVGAGTWTLGGTTSVAATSGTTTFSGLTATSAAAVTGATITFTSTALTGVTSNTFNIVAPAPANDLCNNSISLSNGISTSGTSISATYTTLTSEPYTANSDIWYIYTAINSGTVTVQCTNTASIDYDLFAYASTCPTVATGIGSTPTSSTTSETMTFTATAGTTYYIRVVNSTNTTGSAFTINVSQAIASPTLSSSSNITCSSFVVNWSSVTSATSYKLDVATSNCISKSENFENSMSIFSNSGGVYYSGNSTSSELPASSPFNSSGSYGFGITNGTATLTSNNLNTSSSSNIQLSFKLASFSIGGNANGADAGDIVTVEISPDGGTTYYSTLRVLGNSNATWPFTGTLSASTAYDGNATPVDFQASTNATNGYSLVTVSGLPAVANLKVRITLLNNSTGERWVVDDLNLSSDFTNYVTNYQNTSVLSTSKSVTGLSPNTKYYYRVRSTDGTNTSSNSSVDSVTTTVIPSAPTATATQILCPGASVNNLSATGTAIQWYAASSGGSALSTGASLTNNTNYYATQTVNGCESATRTTVTTSFKNQWTGSISSSWSNNGNWSCGAVPSATDNILIAPNSSNPTILDADFTVSASGTLTISGSGTLTINPGQKLILTGNANFGGNLVTVATNASGTSGAIVLNGGALTGASNVSLQQYFTGQRAWRMLSNPFTTAITAAAISANNTSLSVNQSGTGDMVVYNSANDSWSANNSISANSCYGFFYKGLQSDFNGTPGLSNYSGSGPTATTFTVNGTLNTGAVSITPNASSVFTLVGNPFAAPVNSIALTGGSAAPYYYYQASSASTDIKVKSGAWIAAVSNSSSSTPIPMMGIIAYQAASNAPFSINTSDINITNTSLSNLYKTTSSSNQMVLELHRNNSLFDRLILREDPIANVNKVDANDLVKKDNAIANVYAISPSNHHLALHTEPEFTQAIPLGITAPIGTYQFKFNATWNQGDWYLIDNYMHQQILLSATSPYNFDINSDLTSYGEKRFELLKKTWTTQVENTQLSETILLQTNLVQQEIRFASTQATVNLHYQLKDMNGAVVKSGILQDLNQAINVEQLASGFYIVQLADARQQVSFKIVKQ